MKTAVIVDNETVEGAKELTGITQNSELVHQALNYIIAYEKAVRHARKTGDFHDIRRVVHRLYDNEEIE